MLQETVEAWGRTKERGRRSGSDGLVLLAHCNLRDVKATIVPQDAAVPVLDDTTSHVHCSVRAVGRADAPPNPIAREKIVISLGLFCWLNPFPIAKKTMVTLGKDGRKTRLHTSSSA